MLVARTAAAMAILVVLGAGCGEGHACSNFETANQFAEFRLSCAPTDLTSMSVSGPCAGADASISDPTASASLAISSPSPGVCRVTLTFATGFTYATDVTFVLQSDDDTCPVWHYTAPTQRTFTVNNPSTTCVDAGLDGGGDAATEAASLPVCPGGASESVNCTSPGSCIGCRSNAGFECTCSDAGDSGSEGGGLEWQCIETGVPCAGEGS